MPDRKASQADSGVHPDTTIFYRGAPLNLFESQYPFAGRGHGYVHSGYRARRSGWSAYLCCACAEDIGERTQKAICRRRIAPGAIELLPCLRGGDVSVGLCDRVKKTNCVSTTLDGSIDFDVRLPEESVSTERRPGALWGRRWRPHSSPG